MAFHALDYVIYKRGNPPEKQGYVDHVTTLPSGVVRVTILEDGGAIYHIDARNVRLLNPPVPVPPAPVSTGPKWGINLNDVDATGPSQQIKNLGATNVRVNNLNQVSAVQAAGLTPLIILDVRDKAACLATVKKYGALTYELNNEAYYPGTWVAPPDYAARVKDVVNTCRIAVPAAKFLITGAPDVKYDSANPNDAQPKGGQWRPWFDWLFDAVPDLGLYFDGWTMHPYGPLDGTEHDASGGWQTIPHAYKTLKARLGASSPLHITEVGLKIGSPNGYEIGTEADQDAHMKRYIQDTKSPPAGWPTIASLYWFSLGNYGPNDQWGLIRDDGSQRPAAGTLKSSIT